MFSFLKKKAEEIPSGKELIGAPIKGLAVESTQVKDPTFANEMLGKGLAIKPAEGKLYAPVDGKIEMLIDSMHAVSITSEQGAELLLHVGLETVELQGKHFTSHVKEGQKVTKGQLLLEFDMEAIVAAGYDVISPMIVCNSDDYADVVRMVGKEVQVGDPVMELTK